MGDRFDGGGGRVRNMEHNTLAAAAAANKRQKCVEERSEDAEDTYWGDSPKQRPQLWKRKKMSHVRKWARLNNTLSLLSACTTTNQLKMTL